MQGIQSLGPGVAEKMAAMGRYDDDQIAHVAEGEVIVPAPILKYYPEIKAQVFSAIEEQGLNPEEFIVGGEMVAINPRTGVQEFGWLSKTFKKLKKIVKKAAPLLLAVALPMAAPAIFGAGTVASAALTGAAAGGIGSLVQGNNLEDSLKAAATGAAIGGITAGVSGKPMTAAGKSGVPMDLGTAATPDISATTGSTSTANAGMGTANAGMGAPSTAAGIPSAAPGVNLPDTTYDLSDLDRFRPPTEVATAATPTATAAAPTGYTADLTSSTSAANPFSSSIEQQAALAPLAPPAPTFDELMAMPAPGTTGTATELSARSLSEIAGPTQTFGDKIASLPGKTYDGIVNFPENYVDNLIEKPFGTLLNTGTTALTGLSLYEAEQARKEQERLEAERLANQLTPEQYADMFGGEEFQSYQGKVASGLFYNPETRLYQDTPFVPGGGIVSAAVGGHISGPGTGTSDSIPAYLSDGEFVMTADAVKGAGNGSRQKGAAKMYAMMNRFEGQA